MTSEKTIQGLSKTNKHTACLADSLTQNLYIAKKLKCQIITCLSLLISETHACICDTEPEMAVVDGTLSNPIKICDRIRTQRGLPTFYHHSAIKYR